VLIIPAIDLLGGECVRLYQGEYNRSTVYDRNPAEVARRFEAAGARRIHLVDLDAARGSGDNHRAIAAVRAAVSCVLEVGGGVRSESDVRALVAAGADRVVVGTMLVRDPEAVAAWAAVHPYLIGGVDARDGKVRIAGWEAGSELSDEEVARRAAQCGLKAIIHTDIARDGTLEGPSIDRSVRVARASGLPVILSGGIGAEGDLARAAQCPELVGAIVGRALYEGRVVLSRAIEQFQSDVQAGQENW